MSGGFDDLLDSVRLDTAARSEALQKLLSGADSGRVFGQPVSSGGYTVIPAAEIASGGGFGSGVGFGGARRGMTAVAGESQPAAETGGLPAVAAALPAPEGAGGGGGGGGGAMGRPVAVIVIGPDGVNVKPVVDVTKLALTAIGAWGAVAAISMKMWRKK
jgi:uncharacterized spore protein YtfJ